MNILIADQFSEPGGAQQVLIELLPAFQGSGWTCELALPAPGPLRTRAEELGIRCHEITCGPFGCGSKSLPDMVRFVTQFSKLRNQFRRLVDAFHPDVLYINGPRLVPAVCSLGNDAPPILFHLHSYLRSRSVAALTGRCLRLAEASIVANCRYVLEPLRGYLVDSSIEVIYNGVRGCVPGEPDQRISRIGMVGRISPDKGQEVFIRAARLVHSHFPQASFVICGNTQFAQARDESYLREIGDLARGLPVEFTGWREDACEVIRHLDLLVVPSMSQAEATTRVIPEAYSAGVPVLASDLPGIREILRHGETGFLFPPGDAAALADRIRMLMDLPPEVLATVVINARRQFEQRFRLEEFHRSMIATLERVGARAHV